MTVLVVLSAIPVTSGMFRLVEVAGGPAVLPANDRFGPFPVVLVLHIVAAVAFALVGILQFLPGLRRGHRSWHRRAGRLLVPAGLVVAGSGLAMTVLFEAQPGSGPLLALFRLVFGAAMAASLVLGLAAIGRRDVAAHRAWMIRAYAIGLAAGTQVFTEACSQAIFGSGVLASDLAQGAGWVINLTVAEVAIRRPSRPRSRMTTIPSGAPA